jgi:hypothetical protein
MNSRNTQRLGAMLVRLLVTVLMVLLLGALTEQWNGTSWNVVKSPNVGTSFNSLSAVAVVSANDIWAVGFISPTGVGQTLIEQWNGTSWNVVPSIDPGTTSTFLQGVAAITASNVWTVGYELNSPPSSAQTLIEQYCC